MNLSIKYWKHHKGRTLTLFCSIMVSTMTIGMFLARSASQAYPEDTLDQYGYYDIVVPLAGQEEMQKISENSEIVQCETIWSGGTCRTAYSEDIRFDAMDSETAGEICGYRSTFERMGVRLSWATVLNLRSKTIGFIFQSYNLIPELSVRENILLPKAIAKEKPDEDSSSGLPWRGR